MNPISPLVLCWIFIEASHRLLTTATAGITNGLDLTAAYLHYKVQKELADLVCAMAEIGDRGQDYDSGKVSNALWWIWLIHRAFFRGIGKGKGVSKDGKRE